MQFIINIPGIHNLILIVYVSLARVMLNVADSRLLFRRLQLMTMIMRVVWTMNILIICMLNIAVIITNNVIISIIDIAIISAVASTVVGIATITINVVANCTAWTVVDIQHAFRLSFSQKSFFLWLWCARRIMAVSIAVV